MMVFDFFKNRAKEGIEQLGNIATKTSQGKLGEALAETGAYVSSTNEAFVSGLAKSRDALLRDLDNLFGGDMKLEDTLEKLEEVLMMADIGGTTTEEIIDDLRRVAKASKLDPDDIKSVLRARLVQVLEGRGGEALEAEAALAVAPGAGAGGEADEAEADDPSSSSSSSSSFEAAARRRAANRQALAFGSAATDPPLPPGAPACRTGPGAPRLTVFLVIGSNGMGKTTTIGKLAHRLHAEGGLKVTLAACDTFRAAAVEQLEMWADRANATIVRPMAAAPASSASSEGGGEAVSLGSGLGGTTEEKPATVLYRALDQAMADDTDVLIVDTSGRLSNNVQLNAELVKMAKVVEKRLGRPPHETLLVVDAAIGRNAVDQARVWRDEVGVSGVVVTKLDGTARAGYVVGLVRDLGLPVKLVGVGEKLDDLRDFDPPSFVDALLGYDEAASKALQLRLGKTLAKPPKPPPTAKARPAPKPAAAAETAPTAAAAGGGGSGLEFVLPDMDEVDRANRRAGGGGGAKKNKKKKIKNKKKK